MVSTLHYFYEPLCGWCYGAAPLVQAAAEQVQVQAHGGGLMAGAALALAARIHQDFVTPLRIEDQTVDLGTGIGIALAPSQGRETRSLLARAELAMYAAKRAGRQAAAR